LPKFVYTVKDKDGVSSTNTINIASKEALISHLQQRELFIVSITKAAQADIAPRRSSKKKKKQFRRKKIKFHAPMLIGRWFIRFFAFLTETTS